MDNIKVELSDKEMKRYHELVSKVAKAYADEGEQLGQVNLMVGITPYGIHIEVGTAFEWKGDSKVIRDLIEDMEI